MDNVLIGMRKDEIDTPALCVDAERMERNIRTMMEHLKPLEIGLRPHTKTHKCPIMARKQLEAGALGVCCAKLGEAEAMAEGGVTGILIPNQIVGRRKIARLVHLARWADVMVAVAEHENAAELDAAAQAAGVRLKVIIEVDVGMDRCGTRTVEEGVRLAQDLAARPGLDFRGIMGYEGHCVMAMPFEERERNTRTSLEKLIQTKDAIVAAGIPVPIVSGGGTGTYQITPTIAGMTEIQAGSYITMDSKYRSVGLTAFDMALTVLSTVISVPRPDMAICDIGLKSMTKEFGMPEVARPAGWEVLGLSEEHGKLGRVGGPALRPGDVIEVYPSHGCTTINLHDSYFVTRGDVLEAVWPITARGKFR